MKKLITMIGAAAAAFGLYAETVDLVSSAISAEAGEFYEEGTSVLTQDGWYMAESAADAAVVKAYGEETAPSHTALYAASSPEIQTQARYIGLDAEAPVYRTFAPINGQGTMDEVAIETAERGGIIADQLVKFSAFEDDPTEFGDAKIAVWVKTVQEENGETPAVNHLMISTAALSEDFTPTPTNIDTKVRVDVAQWHHLKITAIKAGNLDTDVIPGFIVEFDGAVIAEADGLFPAAGYYTPTAQGAELIAAKKLFPSMILVGTGGSGTLQGIAFKGTGSIDDITVAAAPVYANTKTINVTLAKDVTISAVSVGTFNGTAWTFPIGTTTGTITLVAPEGKLFSNGQSTITIPVNDLTGDINLSENTVEDAKAQIGTVLYLTLNAAFDAVKDGETVVMLDNVSLAANEKIVIMNKAVTLAGAFTVTAAGRAFNVQQGGTLTISSETTVIGTGTPATIFLWPYDFDSRKLTSDDAAHYGKAKLVVNGTVKYTTTGNEGAISSNGNDSIAESEGVEVIINGTVINECDSALYLPGKGTCTVNDGAYIEGTYAGIQMKAVTLTVNGGTIKATSEDQTPTALWANGAKPSGCAIQMEGNTAYAGGINLTVNGGTIESVNAKAIYAYGAQEKFGTISIAGGTIKGNTGVFLLDEGMNKAIVPGTSKAQFNQDVTAFCEEGYETVKLPDAQFYTVQAKQPPTPTYTVTFSTNTVVVAEKTLENVVSGTQLTKEQIPDFGEGTWDVQPLEATITSNTNFNFTVKVDAGKPITPPQGKTPQALAEEMNTKGIENYLKVPAVVTEDKAAYTAMFAAKPDGKGAVIIDLKTEVETAIKAELANTTTSGSMLNPDAETSEVTITARPGLFYGIKAVGDVKTIGAANGQNWVQASGATVNVVRPTVSGNAAFFQAVCSPTAPTQNN